MNTDRRSSVGRLEAGGGGQIKEEEEARRAVRDTLNVFDWRGSTSLTVR